MIASIVSQKNSLCAFLHFNPEFCERGAGSYLFLNHLCCPRIRNPRCTDIKGKGGGGGVINFKGSHGLNCINLGALFRKIEMGNRNPYKCMDLESRLTEPQLAARAWICKLEAV